MLSIGACSLPPAPRTRFVNDCWIVVNSRRASSSVSAATTLTPTIAYGWSNCFDGLNVSTIDVERSQQRVGREVRSEGVRQVRAPQRVRRRTCSIPKSKSEPQCRRPEPHAQLVPDVAGASNRCNSNTSSGKYQRAPDRDAAHATFASLFPARGPDPSQSDPDKVIRVCQTVRRLRAANGSAA